MAKKRQLPADTLADNLTRLMAKFGYSNRKLGELSGISDRYIGMIRNGDNKATVDVADALAKPFGLTGWQLIIPGLDIEAAANGRIDKLVRNYQKAPPASRDYIDGIAARDAKYQPDNDGKAA